MLLRPSVKNYSWGRLGGDSLVAVLGAGDEGISEETPYAELWMGTHPSGPSKLEDGTLLLDYIEKHPETLGSGVLEKFGPKLPFLFKVLSVQKGLSIQAHPDIPLAQKLHKRDPANYPDDNHKPEMAIAVTPFEVLCGFRSLSEIQRFLEEVPELRALVGGDEISTKEDLRKVFTRLLKSDSSKVAEKLKELINRPGVAEWEDQLIHRLNSQYPGDVGVFCVFFLQHFVLQPGQALFLPANEPHAYLSGDCLECMANSDNVVRAGLTPKFKDVEVLTEMLTFENGKDWIFKGQDLGDGRVVFTPPVNEFAVESFTMKQNFVIDSNESCSVLITLEGTGTLNGTLGLSKGTVIFLPSGVTGSITVTTPVKIFRAFCPA